MSASDPDWCTIGPIALYLIRLLARAFFREALFS